jgi:PAS domain S-box-containing protein
MLVLFPACGKPLENALQHASFRDIPGVTEGEIKSIEALREQVDHFAYGMIPSTESFYDDNGDLRGFAALFCEWLTGLFGIPFIPENNEFNDLLGKLAIGEVDFTGILTATEERQKIFYMTTPIALHTVQYFRIDGSPPLESIAESRPLRYAMMRGATTIDLLTAKLAPGTYEIVLSTDIDEVYRMLKSGEVDAHFNVNREIAFDAYGDVTASDFLPLIYTSASLATRNPALQPIISVMQKALDNGALRYLAELHNAGYQEYLKHKLSLRLSDEEHLFIKDRPVVPLAAGTGDYPGSFYNSYEKQWQGSAFDILREVEDLTGLRFQLVNNENDDWHVILKKLEDGKASMLTELLYSKEREGQFLWADTIFTVNHPVLISRSHFRNISLNEIMYIKVGLIRDYAYSALFREWFPDHSSSIEYVNISAAASALGRGEVDAVMTGTNEIMTFTHFHERTDYKINYLFASSFNATFGFNKNETVLCSIVNKALRLINTDRITDQWMRKTFNYRRQIIRSQRSWLIGLSVLFSSVLTIIAVLFARNRRADRLIRQRTRELEQKNITLTTLFDSMPDIVFTLDTSLRFTQCNKSFLEHFGLRKEDIINKGEDGLGISDKKTEEHNKWNRRVIEESHTFVIEEHIPRKDGAEPLYETVKMPLMLNGEVIGVLGIARDITTRKKAEKAILAASEAKSLFLATMSHEIRTPINAIIGMTAIGKKSADMEVKNYTLTKIEDASTHLLGIINDILDMSKIEADKLKLSSVEFNFERMLQRVIDVINFRVMEKRQKFSVNIDEKVPRLLVGDDQRLAQVIINLLSNAVKFTPQEGEVCLTVSLMDKREGVCELRLEVADSGIGISPEQQEKLFSAFGQAENGISREFGGTGLGLAISKRIVDLMDGSIWIESEAGKGSRFIFTIIVPYGEENPRSQLAPGVQWDSVRVLVVDDTAFICQFFSGIFDKVGIHYETAMDGFTACKIIEERGGFDVYFIDWRMPEMDGLELTKWIKSRGMRGKVILFSSAELEEIREASLQSGADKCLIKPFLPSAVIDCLNECFGISGRYESHGKDNEFAGKTLLVVEDIEINREILLSLLEHTGLNIDCAENGEEAIALIKAAPGRYDAVLMDMQMPVMDGLKATRRIRAMPDPQCKDLPIIAMTANVFKDDVENCLAAGMNDHVGKPIDIDEMFRKLRKFLKPGL